MKIIVCLLAIISSVGRAESCAKEKRALAECAHDYLAISADLTADAAGLQRQVVLSCLPKVQSQLQCQGAELIDVVHVVQAEIHEFRK